MYLDAVKPARESVEPVVSNGNGYAKPAEVFERWKDWHPSRISHHGEMCCEIAREWVISTDYTSLGGGDVLSGPRWLRHRFKWGASAFPIHWCEAARRKTLDCGALAALAHELFTIRGVRSRRVQLVQRFSSVATAQWSCSWRDAGVPVSWIDRDLIYHEGCAVGDERIKVWDASAGWWIDPRTGDGYGALLAIRISAPGEDTVFDWGEHKLDSNKWTRVG